MTPERLRRTRTQWLCKTRVAQACAGHARTEDGLKADGFTGIEGLTTLLNDSFAESFVHVLLRNTLRNTMLNHTTRTPCAHHVHHVMHNTIMREPSYLRYCMIHSEDLKSYLDRADVHCIQRGIRGQRFGSWLLVVRCVLLESGGRGFESWWWSTQKENGAP